MLLGAVSWASLGSVLVLHIVRPHPRLLASLWRRNTVLGVLTSPVGDSDTCNSWRAIAISLRLMDFHQDKIRTDLIVKLPAPSLAP